MQPRPTSNPDAPWRVICLCADWCGVCRDYSATFDSAAVANPGVAFDWVDVEDESDAMGDLDIKTFPTLLVACGADVRFFGPVLPGSEQLERLLASLFKESAGARAQTPDATPLLQRLLATVLTNS